jgi:hypothetical protein
LGHRGALLVGVFEGLAATGELVATGSLGAGAAEAHAVSDVIATMQAHARTVRPRILAS